MTIDSADCDLTAARLMRLNGLSIRRIALALNVSEYRVRQLLAESGRTAPARRKKRGDGDDQLPPAA